MDIQQMITELGIDKLPEEAQVHIVSEIYKSLQKRIGDRILDSLSEEQLHRYKELSGQDEEAAFDELLKMVPNYEEITSEEIAILKEEVQALLPPNAHGHVANESDGS